MATIKSLHKISFDFLFFAFNEAFKDYEMQVNKAELQIMVNRRGFNPSLSFGAFEDEKLVAFTFNGIGLFNGINTAYDTGTGTLPEFRGQGLATEIFNYSIPFLKKANISQYLLEVLQHNTKAVSVYKNIGFEISREFNYFVQDNSDIKLNSKEMPAVFKLQQTNLPSINLINNFWDFTPSWQNSFEAIKRNQENFKILGVYKDQLLIAYCVFDPNSGDLTQIAVHKEYRRLGIASSLLKEAVKLNLYNSIKIINMEINCESVTGFLLSNGFKISGKQFEMIKTL